MANLTFKINIVQKKYTLFLFSLLFCFHAFAQANLVWLCIETGLLASLVIPQVGSC